MNKPQQCTLIYVEEKKKSNGSPTKVEYERKIKCYSRGVFSSKYYVDRNRDMRTSGNVIVKSYHTTNYNNGQLRYVKFKGKIYEVKNILKADKEADKILDLEECKK